MFYANDLINSSNNCLKWLPVSADEKGLDALRRALAEALKATTQIRPETLRNLRGSLEPNNELITCQRELIGFLEEAHQKISKFHHYHRKLAKASPNRNYQVVSVTNECRRIWGEEKWAEKYGDWGEGKDHEDLVENEAPKSQNHYHPGPFGRFLEDILECLDVRTSRGDVVSAASALQMLENHLKIVEKQERQKTP